MTPEVIGDRYRVKRAIGRGGMGTVWLCTDGLLGRDVAVKQVGLLPHQSAPDSARALREARSSATLNHKNVVSVYDIVETEGSIWMVMEYVPSRTLAQIVREDGPLPPERVADLGAQVADGLAAAHAAGTIHRDVKPDNILVGEDGTAKIGDFGIARMDGDQPLTQSGFVTGTPSYFSPELAEGHDPGPASDVWALGATLYGAVEGSPPYPPEPNPVAMLRTIASRPPARPRRAAFLESALTRMLDRDPASRWSMPDAAHALRRLADRHGTDGTREGTAAFSAPPAAAPDPSPAPLPEAPDTARPAGRPGRTAAGRDRDRGRRRSALLPLLAVLAAVLLAGGVGLALVGLPHGPDQGAGGGRQAAGTTQQPSADPSGHHSSAPSSAPASPGGGGSGGGGSGGDAAAASPAAFLHDYFRTAPQDLDAGWSRLGPAEKRVGRASYDRFWRSIDSVDLADVRPGPSGSTVDVTLTYHFASGKVVAERQRLKLIRSPGGGYLINNDDVLSSRTVRR